MSAVWGGDGAWGADAGGLIHRQLRHDTVRCDRDHLHRLLDGSLNPRFARLWPEVSYLGNAATGALHKLTQQSRVEVSVEFLAVWSQPIINDFFEIKLRLAELPRFRHPLWPEIRRPN